MVKKARMWSQAWVSALATPLRPRERRSDNACCPASSRSATVKLNPARPPRDHRSRQAARAEPKLLQRAVRGVQVGVVQCLGDHGEEPAEARGLETGAVVVCDRG